MKVEYSEKAWEGLEYWIDNDLEVVEKIRKLVTDCQRTPFKGLGKPEPLKGALQGFRSRRITHEHRLVYSVSGSGKNQVLHIVQCRYHYDT